MKVKMRNRRTVNKFIIKKDLVKKYNNLLDEVIAYYNIPDIELYCGLDDLNTFTIRKSGTDGLYVDIIVNMRDFIKASKFLIKTYPYLVPFFQLYASLLNFTDIDFGPEHLERINIVVKEMRKKKDKYINNNVKKTHNRKI